MSAEFDLFGNRIAINEAEQQSSDVGVAWRQSRYAEFMVCAYLTRMGHHAIHVDTIGFDIVLDYEGNSYRIDVKCTDYYYRGPFKEACEWNTGKHNSAGKSRMMKPSDADLLALYHLTFSSLVFVPVLGPIKRVRLPAAQVRNAGMGEHSLAIAIQQLKGANRDGSLTGVST